MDTSHLEQKQRQGEHRELDNAALWAQLANATNLRSSQDQVLWSIFGTFWAANAILLVALFTGGSLPTDPIVGIVLGAVGMFLSFIWCTIQGRALGHLMRYEQLIERIETALDFNPEFAVSASLNRQTYDKLLRGGLRARKVMRASSVGAIMAWAALFILFLVKAIR